MLVLMEEHAATSVTLSICKLSEDYPQTLAAISLIGIQLSPCSCTLLLHALSGLRTRYLGRVAGFERTAIKQNAGLGQGLFAGPHAACINTRTTPQVGAFALDVL